MDICRIVGNDSCVVGTSLPNILDFFNDQALPVNQKQFKCNLKHGQHSLQRGYALVPSMSGLDSGCSGGVETLAVASRLEEKLIALPESMTNDIAKDICY